MKLSKIVNNNNNWTKVRGISQTGISVFGNNANKISYHFGLEEWNNSSILRKHKLAYLDSFRSFQRTGNYDRIEIVNFNKGIIYHVGRIEHVVQLKCEEIPTIKELISEENWLSQVEKDFNAIQDLRKIENHNEYMRCWNSKKIIAPINEGFIVNIRYENLILFKDPINLSEKKINANSIWKRLIHLYNVNVNLENYFNS